MGETLSANQNGFDHWLDELSDLVIRQQAVQFTSSQEAQRHARDVKAKLKKILLKNNTSFVQGLRYLVGTDHQIVAAIAKQIHDHLDSPAQVSAIIDAEITQRKDALALFSKAVNSFYGCGDFHIEECVLAVLLTLFPLEPQPFACYGTMIWRKDGIAEAAAYYKKIVDLIESPVLDYFAADCYFKSGNNADAKRLLDRAMKTVNETPGSDDDVGQLIRILSKQF
jgi:predicted Zn-dependent protease